MKEINPVPLHFFSRISDFEAQNDNRMSTEGVYEEGECKFIPTVTFQDMSIDTKNTYITKAVLH